MGLYHRTDSKNLRKQAMMQFVLHLQIKDKTPSKRSYAANAVHVNTLR